MELLMIFGGVLLVDILAVRFGVDSRLLNLRQDPAWWPDPVIGDQSRDLAMLHQAQLHREAELDRLASQATAVQPSLRIRLAQRLRTLAAAIEPTPSCA